MLSLLHPFDREYLSESSDHELREHLRRARNSGDELTALAIAEELYRRSNVEGR